MRRRLMGAVVAVAALVGGGAAAMSGGSFSAAPGPNGHNDYGLCKAYFAGSAKGQEMKRTAPPFVALEAAAEEADQSVEEYCAEATPGGK
jgi:hypothetical protein